MVPLKKILKYDVGFKLKVVEFAKKNNNCGNIRVAPLDKLRELVEQARDAIDPVIVKTPFLKCGIFNSPDGKEDDWLWKDCDDVPVETVDNEWDPYNDALTDADML